MQAWTAFLDMASSYPKVSPLRIWDVPEMLGKGCPGMGLRQLGTYLIGRGPSPFMRRSVRPDFPSEALEPSLHLKRPE